MGCSSIPADGSGSNEGLLITAGWGEFWPPVVCTDTTLAEGGRVPHYCFLHGLAPHCGAKEEDLITPQLWLISCLSARPHRRPQWRGEGMSCYHLLCYPHWDCRGDAFSPPGRDESASVLLSYSAFRTAL
ncbi:unnamed protein product [Rangifer tarandus platyrhynchus]|uniref:Uncharacterized protein n=2 Tax=Rangifer tarandus platyrhynchus TaxID=3082113 RepID=A0AC59Z8P1_RANTA|nr:unnamed protein product [Rangifer tarandus platyrhynchus]